MRILDKSSEFVLRSYAIALAGTKTYLERQAGRFSIQNTNELFIKYLKFYRSLLHKPLVTDVILVFGLEGYVRWV